MRASTIPTAILLVCSLFLSVQALSFNDIDKAISHAWHDVEKTASSVWNDVEHKAGDIWSDVSHKASDVWGDLESGVTKDTETINDRLQEIITDVASNAPIHESLKSTGLSLPDIADALSAAYNVVVQQLEAAFPPPDEAPGHEERQAAMNYSMALIGNATVGLLVDTLHLPAEQTRQQWDSLSAAINHGLVTVADLVEQHPQLVITAVGLILVELDVASFLLRPLIRLSGFGPLGPVKGTFAAWAQRYFWGAEVEAGSVFAILQKAGMTL